MTNEKSPTKLYVIVGRRTFSSGILYVLEFQKLTNAKFFGEPTGGKPIHYGDMRNMTLPNSKLNITYSTKFLKTSTNEADTFTPDFIIEPSIKDYLKGIGPVIETIKSKH
nr:S41 family peptidase [Clostridium sp. KNHs214]